VTVLQRGYDDKEEVAWVEVGISKKTIGAARFLSDAINEDQLNSRGRPRRQTNNKKEQDQFKCPEPRFSDLPKKIGRLLPGDLS
jgi:hypothetical protein